jgi:hypothetical protein
MLQCSNYTQKDGSGILTLPKGGAKRSRTKDAEEGIVAIIQRCQPLTATRVYPIYAYLLALFIPIGINMYRKLIPKGSKRELMNENETHHFLKFHALL